jgi:dTMP kinase
MNAQGFPLEKPPFIVIEGLDGAGTTTQSRRLCERLQAAGQPALVTCEPSGGPIGTLIRQMLAMRVVVPHSGGFRPVSRETLALLFAADRIDHVEAEIEPALDAGQLVISDRYYHSSLVYQGDIDEHDHCDQMDYTWVKLLNSRARVPALTIFLEASTDLCMSRLTQRGGRQDIFETRTKIARLERRYDEVMTLLEAEGQPIARLDASLPIDDLSDTIFDLTAKAR